MSVPPVDLSCRADALERMDDLNCSGEVVHQTLKELEFINRWLGGNKVTLDAVRKLILRGNPPSESLITVADLGCGGGDILKRIADIGRRHRIPMKLIGIDANPNIVDYARNNCTGYSEIAFETTNVLSTEFARQSYDIIIGTLFFHHFDNKTLTTLLTQLKGQVRVGLIINDIHRHWLAYHAIRLLTQLFSSSSMVKVDAPLSVQRAFTRKEWTALLAASGIEGYSLKWKWAFRWKISIPGQ